MVNNEVLKKDNPMEEKKEVINNQQFIEVAPI